MDAVMGGTDPAGTRDESSGVAFGAGSGEAPCVQGRAQWQVWLANWGCWWDYKSEHLKLIEDAWQRGQTRVNLPGAHFNRCVDLEALKQTNTETHTERRIRRVWVTHEYRGSRPRSAM